MYQYTDFDKQFVKLRATQFRDQLERWQRGELSDEQLLPLRRLRTDRIDVYFAHQDDPDTPQDAMLEAFGRLIDAGKVRAMGASNFHAARLKSALDIAREHGLPHVHVLQPEYNLVSRKKFEGELQDLCRGSCGRPKVRAGVAQDLPTVGHQQVLPFEVVVQRTLGAVDLEAVRLDHQLGVPDEEVRAEPVTGDRERRLVLDFRDVVPGAQAGHERFEHALRFGVTERPLVEQPA